MKDKADRERAPWHRVGGYAAWRCDAASFDLFWISRAAPSDPHAHRILPTGEPSIAIRRQRDADGAVSSVEAVVCATYDGAFWYRPRPREELIALRLKPEYSARLFGVDARDYLNLEPAPAPALLAAHMDDARRAAEHGSARDVAEALIAGVKRATESEGASLAIECVAAAAIRNAGGRIAMRALAADLGVSDRHLRRRFASIVGCGPKNYARRIRLTAAAIAADKEAAPDWAEIAAATGYHDQAHMIGEFVALAGLSPARAHAERKAQSVFSNTSATVSP